MIHLGRKAIIFWISFCLLASLTVLLAGTVAAGEVITSTVNIAIANKNERGPGYYWANRYDVLTLSGVNIDTEEAYGLRLPKNCTVVLEGNNTVKASKYGISCSGTVTFKGKGSLTVEAGEIGIYLISQDSTQKIRLVNGTYKITAGTYGIYSDASDFSFVGKSMDISVNNPDGSAILGRCVNLLGGTFTANAPVETTHQLAVEGVNIRIDANRAALSSKTLTVKKIDFGTDSDYNGESSISGKSTSLRSRKSILFGDAVGGWVDYLLLVLLAVGVAAGIFGPALRRKKKARELYERLEKEGYDIVK